MYTGRPLPGSAAAAAQPDDGGLGLLQAGDSPRLRSAWAVSRGAACEITTVGAMRTSPRPAAAGGVEQFQQGRLVLALDEAGGGAHPEPGMARGGVFDEVLQGLRDGGGRMLAQEVQHGRGVLAGVEGPADRGDGEAVDGGRTLAFGDRPW